MDIGKLNQWGTLLIWIGAIIRFDHQGKKVRTTISAGIMCCVPNFNTSSDSIISCADKALYMAKEGGKNRVAVFTSGSNDT